MTDPSPSGEAEKSRDDRSKTLSIILKESKTALTAELDTAQQLRSYAGTVLSVLVGFTSTALALEGVISRPPLWAYIPPVAVFLVSLGITTKAFLGVGKVPTAPDPNSLKAFESKSPDELKVALIDAYSTVVTNNHPKVIDAGKWVSGSVVSLMATVTVVVLFALAYSAA